MRLACAAVMKKNQRKHPRYAARGVSSHYKSSAALALAMPIENISLGGVFIRTDEPLDIGTALALELIDGSPRPPLKLTGRVIGTVTARQSAQFARPAGMGVAFDPPLADAAMRLQTLVS